MPLVNTLHVIGTSADTDLSPNATEALQQANIVIGSAHQIECVKGLLPNNIAHFDYPRPLSKLKALIEKHQQQKIVILASGDPLLYGIGGWLGREFAADKVVFHPNTSSIQSAFARLGRSWQDASVVSLHGRPLISLRSALKNNSLYALLTDSESTPQAIAIELVAHGYQDSTLWVCEDLGGANEKVREYTALKLMASKAAFNPLNVVIVETAGNHPLLPEFPGIPDTFFDTDGELGKGMLSKREVRLNILSLLQPAAQQVGWDVGAGCGGVSVEWARWNPNGQVHSIEYHAERLACLHSNRDKFGVVKNLHIHKAKAPAAFTQLPDPSAIFVGGSSGPFEDILAQCWERLLPGGRLVCAAVTEHTRMKLYQFADELEVEKPEIQWVEIGVSKGDSLGGRLLLRPQLPVLLVSFVKASGAQ